ncbi:MAG: ROK family protein [bacterium]
MSKISIGIDVGGTTIKAGLVEDNKVISEVMILPTPSSQAEFIDALSQIVVKFDNLADSNTAIGLAVPGLVNIANGQIMGSSTLPFLSKIQFNELFADRPITFYNDVDAALAGEVFANGLQSENVLLINIGTGLGSAFYLNGLGSWQLDLAAEAGHLKVIPNGRKCSCGGDGCIQAYFSGRALLLEAREKISREIASTKALFDLAKAGEATAAKIIESNASLLGVAIANCVNLLGVERVIIGGQIASSFEVFSTELEASIKSNIFRLKERKIIIEPSKSIGLSGIIGAGYLVSLSGK